MNSPIFFSIPTRQSPDSLVLFTASLCFLLSGFSALLYQIAWSKSLAIVFGTSYLAVATVLAAYMGGLALGATIAARMLDRVRNAILVYGVLEAVISVSALAVPVLLKMAGSLLVVLLGNQAEPVSSNGYLQTAYYLAATFVVLAVPTSAMGATLPLLARYVINADRQVGPRLGLLYGINTIGAVFGALVAGFLLLPVLGLMGTLFVGAIINLAVFAVAIFLARLSAGADEAAERRRDDTGVRPAINIPSLHWVMPVMLASGAVSFTLEILWTRLLSHLFGGTVYAFSIMLACFLSGIAIGGFFAGRLAKDQQHASAYFAGSQILIALLSYASYSLMGAWIPVSDGLLIKGLYAFLIIVPSTLFIGATYPLAVRMVVNNSDETGSLAGRVYAWNTVGAIFGSLLCGFFFLPQFGFGTTLKIAMTLSLALATIALVKRHPKNRTAGSLVAVLTVAVMLFLSPARPDRVVYVNSSGIVSAGVERFYAVGQSATILLQETNDFFKLSSNGLSESAIGHGGKPPYNLSQKWLSGLPTLARPDAASMLIIGLGCGVALEGVPPHISSVDVIELEPMVLAANQSIAPERGDDPLADPRISVVLNDARNALKLTQKTYDIIVSQPSHPWTGGAAHLYTVEFLQQAKSHLNPGGVFLQWINSRFLDEELLQTLMATLADQFSFVELYQPEREVLFFLASDKPLEIWDGQQGAAMALRRYPRHYNRMGMRSPEDIIAMLSLNDAAVRSFSADAPLNTDDHNLLAFYSLPGGKGLTSDDMQTLFLDMDPLTTENSDLHRNFGDRLALHHVAEQLLQGRFIQRTYQLARAASLPDITATIDALGYDHSGETEKARAAFNEALIRNPENGAARAGLLRTYMGAFARGQLPPEVAALANQLRGPERRVLEGWVFGAAGAFGRLAALDAELAMVPPTSLFYPVSVKLRVDWRILLAKQKEDPAPAVEALIILDDLLASYWNLDLYLLRAVAAQLAGNNIVFRESVAAASRQVRARIALPDDSDLALNPDEAKYLKGRLLEMRGLWPATLTVSSSDRAAVVMMELNRTIEAL